MRRLLAGTMLAATIAVGGATGAEGASASAPQAARVQESALTAAAPAHTGAQGVAAATRYSSAADATVVHPERRTPRPRARSQGRKRGFFSRLFGTLAFLFIGLPLLIVLALVLWFMLRRARKQREVQMRAGQMNGQYPTSPQQPTYRSGPNDRS